MIQKPIADSRRLNPFRDSDYLVSAEFLHRQARMVLFDVSIASSNRRDLVDLKAPEGLRHVAWG